MKIDNDGLEEQGTSGATINRELAVLKRAYHLGMKRTPKKVRECPQMPGNRESDARTGFLEAAQYAPLAMECSKVGLWLRSLLTVAYTFAFRKGELLDLRVKQIDLANGKHGAIRLESANTKNKKPRIIKLTQETSTLLTACCIGKAPDAHVFTRPDKKRKDGMLVKGGPVKGFRKVWEQVCCSSGVGHRVCRDCYEAAEAEAEELQKPIVPPPPADEKGKCPDCGKTWKRYQLMYSGLIFHDLRRTGIRNLVRDGTQETVAMKISGHKTRSVFDRYNIVSESDLADAADRIDARQNANAPEFGLSLGSIAQNSTKNAAPEQANIAAAHLPN